MHKITNRLNFFDEFFTKKKMYDQLIWSDRLARDIQNHQYMKVYIEKVKDWYNDITPESVARKKCLVLFEITQSKSLCRDFISFLEKDGQREVASVLRKYNSDQGTEQLDRDLVEIEVIPLHVPTEKTNAIMLSRNPRGYCIIVNNMVNPNGQQTGNYGLLFESLRFKHVFTKFHFIVVDNLYNLPVEVLKVRLENLSNERTIEEWKNDEAFIFMIIAHGEDDYIYGGSACNLIENRPPNMNEQEFKKATDKDKISKREILDYFTDAKFPGLKNTPKLFFFTCCRESVPAERDQKEAELKIVPFSKLQVGYNLSQSFICHSTQWGNLTQVWPGRGITVFGEAFSTALAMHGHAKSLDEIMLETDKLIRRIYNDHDALEHYRRHTPDVCKTDHLILFFQPGIIEHRSL